MAYATLHEAGIKLRNQNHGNHKTTCPQCSHKRKNKNDPCLSVSITSDGVVWNCHHCDFSGGLKPEHYQPPARRQSYVQPQRETKPQRPSSLIEWFEKRSISEQTVEHFSIYKTTKFFPQTSSELECIAFPYEYNQKLRNVKYRTANKHFRQEKNPEPVLFNADSIGREQDLIWVEGEMDVLSLHEAGFWHVVSLPNGAPGKPETSDKRYEPLGTHWEELKEVSRHIIATDNDAAGDNLAGELARRLGKDKCLRVNFSQGKDANECLMACGAETLKQDVANASPWPIDGLFSASDFSGDVLDLYHNRGPQAQSTGFSEFDRAFKFLPGQFIVVTGIPNHGKSRFVDQVAVQTANHRGEKWALFSPETSESQHIADLIEIKAGGHFFEGPTDRLNEIKMREAMDWVNNNFVFIGSKEHTPKVDWVIERARAAVVRHGIKHLVIDPYNELEASRPNGQTETEFVSQLISKLKRFAKHHEVTVWMVIHPTKMQRNHDGTEPVPGLYDLSGSAHWRNKADAGLVVYRDYENQVTHVIAKKIRRQPICGSPGAVQFTFLSNERKFQQLPDTYQPLGLGKVG